MDEFKAAGFDKETCERLREIMNETGIPPSSLIGAIRGFARTALIIADVVRLHVSDIDAIPSVNAADVVEVVRCEKCKYFFDNCCWHPKNSVAYRVPDFGESYVYKDGIEIKPDHFCSYGERRKGAKNE